MADPEKSSYQKALDSIQSQQRQERENFLKFLMSNPGFLSTFGDDFVMESGPVTVVQDKSGEYNDLNEYRLTFTQDVRFYTRETWEKYQQAHKTNLMDDVTAIRKQLQAAFDRGDEVEATHYQNMLQRRADQLAEMGLRMDRHGNLEAV